MARCVICDFSNEIAKDQGEPNWSLRMKWDEHEKGFVCNVCTTEVREALDEFGFEDLDEVDGSAFLEDEGLEEDQGDNLVPG